MQINSINSRSNQPSFGESKLLGGLKTIGRGVSTAFKYMEDVQDEAASLVKPEKSKVLHFIKTDFMRYISPIYIPIRRMLKKPKQ